MVTTCKKKMIKNSNKTEFRTIIITFIIKKRHILIRFDSHFCSCVNYKFFFFSHFTFISLLKLYYQNVCELTEAKQYNFSTL